MSYLPNNMHIQEIHLHCKMQTHTTTGLTVTTMANQTARSARAVAASNSCITTRNKTSHPVLGSLPAEPGNHFHRADLCSPTRQRATRQCCLGVFLQHQRLMLLQWTNHCLKTAPHSDGPSPASNATQSFLPICDAAPSSAPLLVYCKLDNSTG